MVWLSSKCLMLYLSSCFKAESSKTEWNTLKLDTLLAYLETRSVGSSTQRRAKLMGLTSYLIVLEKNKWQSFNWTTLTEATGVTAARLTLDDRTTKEASSCQKQPVISFVHLSLQIISRSASMPASRKDNASGKVSFCIKTEEKYAPLKSK